MLMIYNKVLYVRNERCGEVERGENACVKVSWGYVTSLLSQGKEGGQDGHSRWLRKLGVCLISFTVCETCSESPCLDGTVFSCRKTDIATCIVHLRFREAFSLTVYSSA